MPAAGAPRSWRNAPIPRRVASAEGGAAGAQAPAPDRAAAAARARIVGALIELGAEYGYLDTTVEMVIERAGVDRKTFARHFRGKHDCFLTAWHEINERCVASMVETYEGEDGWANGLRAVTHEAARSLQRYPQQARFGIEVLAAGNAARARRDMTLRVIAALIDAGRNEMDDADSVPHTTAEALAGSAYSQMFSKVATGQEEELPELVPQLMSAMVMPYLGIEAALEELTNHPCPPGGVPVGSVAGLAGDA